MKLKSKSALALSALLASTALMAQTAPTPDYTLSYNVGVVSDYRFRGISQTSRDPALQGGVDLGHKSGLYLGVWGSHVKWIKDYALATDGSLEIDVYGGFRGAINDKFSFDLGAIRYQYPNNNIATSANTTELYAALTYGFATAKYSRSTTNFVANPDSKGSEYFEVAANFDLGNGFTLTPHIGRQTVPHVANDAADYTDYSLTLGKDFGNGLSATLAAIGTNAEKAFYTDSKSEYLGKDTLVLGLKYSF